MTITDEERAELAKAARPLIKWLCENCHPHVTAIVDPGRIQLLEGVSSIPIEDYIRP